MKYVYQLTSPTEYWALYFSSWHKAFRYCNDKGAIHRAYEDEKVTKMTDDNGLDLVITKHKVK